MMRSETHYLNHCCLRCCIVDRERETASDAGERLEHSARWSAGLRLRVGGIRDTSQRRRTGDLFLLVLGVVDAAASPVDSPPFTYLDFSALSRL